MAVSYPTEAQELDRFDRKTWRFWTGANLGDFFDHLARPIDDGELAKAFRILDCFADETPLDGHRIHPSLILGSGACRVIRQAMDERPEQRVAIMQQLATYYDKANFHVACIAMRALERSETCFRLALPHLRCAASATETVLGRPEGFSMRGIAFVMLYRLDPAVLDDPALTTARQEGADIFAHWVQNVRNPEAELLQESARLRGDV